MSINIAAQTSIQFPASLAVKYQPRSIHAFCGIDKVKRVLSKFVQNPYACSFLFHGPPGVGKTSMAQAMAEEMGAEFHHLGSQKCNIETLEQVCRTCEYIPLNGGFHFILIDEIDSASKAAQLSLLSRLDSTNSPKRTVFVFTCNTLENLEPRFISRCLELPFQSHGIAAEAARLLETIWEREAGDAEKPNFLRIVQSSKNNIRDAVNSLQVELLNI
jgi:replication-associated recombination protein RarA